LEGDWEYGTQRLVLKGDDGSWVDISSCSANSRFISLHLAVIWPSSFWVISEDRRIETFDFRTEPGKEIPGTTSAIVYTKSMKRKGKEKKIGGVA
jgi:hypothetical protein